MHTSLRCLGYLGALGLLAVACSDASGSSGSSPPKKNDGTNEPILDGGLFIPVDATSPDPANSDCSDAAKKIYLVANQNDLYAFSPATKGIAAYESIGRLNCPSSSTPQSMAVDRNGTAYVFYSSGQLFRVSTSDASCTAIPSYRHPVPDNPVMLGMGFTATTPGSKEEVLYIQSPDFGLARVDTSTFQVEQTKKFPGIAAELTGGQDGKLFHFEAMTGKLAEINLATMQSSFVHSLSIQGISAWAFARWGGQFYLFTAGFGLSKTTIYNPATGLEELRDANVGFTIVGAGQSTCAPLEMPK